MRGGGPQSLGDLAGQEVMGGGRGKKGGLGSSVRSVGADSSAKPPTPPVLPPPRALQGKEGSPQSAGAEGRKFKTSLLNLVLAPRPRHGDQHNAQAHSLRERAARYREIGPLSATIVGSLSDSFFFFFFFCIPSSRMDLLPEARDERP